MLKLLNLRMRKKNPIYLMVKTPKATHDGFPSLLKLQKLWSQCVANAPSGGKGIEFVCTCLVEEWTCRSSLTSEALGKYSEQKQIRGGKV